MIIGYGERDFEFVQLNGKKEKINKITGEIEEYKKTEKEIVNIKSKSRTIKSIYDITKSNEWEYFTTFTFDKKKVDRYNYEEITNKFSKWLRNQKSRVNKNMYYIVVAELHKDGAYHFHGLFSNVENWKIKKATNPRTGELLKYKEKQIYSINQYKLGISEISKVKDTDKVANYITKYITKELITQTENKRRYWASKNLKKPEKEMLYLKENQILELKKQVKNKMKNAKSQYIKEVNVISNDYENNIIYMNYTM